MQEMTSMERIMKTLNHEEPDRVPVLFLAITIGAREARVNQVEYCTNGKVLAQGQLNFLERYKVDGLTPSTGVAFRAEAFGAKIKIYDTQKDSPVIEEGGVRNAEDWEKLELHMTAPGISAYLEALKILSDKLDGKVPVLAGSNSPLTLATHLAGLGQVMKDIKRHPEALHKGLSLIAELYGEYLNAIFEAAPIDLAYFASTRATAEIVKLEQYQEFGVPYDLKVLEYFKKRNCPVMLHVCGNHPMLDLIIPSYPVAMVNWYDRGTEYSVGDIKQKYGDKITIVGGLDQNRTLIMDNPQEVEEQAKDAIRQAAKGGGFILSGGCELSAISPPENIHAAVNAAKEYGTYPIDL